MSSFNGYLEAEQGMVYPTRSTEEARSLGILLAENLDVPIKYYSGTYDSASSLLEQYEKVDGVITRWQKKR